jgi:2-aminoadipate transaminase
MRDASKQSAEDGDIQSLCASVDAGSGAPLYRQLADSIASQIAAGEMKAGDRLPPTRELALKLGLNRTTVSAAYSRLEEQGLIKGHVGRGSFVSGQSANSEMAGLDWDAILPRLDTTGSFSQPAEISFAASRPDLDAFPMAQFRRLAKEVIDSPEAREILQLGSPLGYPPLRRYLVEQGRSSGIARETDDLIVTNGCQQALDLLARVLAPAGETVVLEDPVYHGLLKVFERVGANIIPAPVGEEGVRPETIEAILSRHRPRAIVLTPSFQNPTGTSIPALNRRRIVEIAQRAGVVLIENDIYSELRYEGDAISTLKRLDEGGNVILLRSYSKVSFPGLRVGWVLAPRPVVQRLAECKQTCDLHSDQLSQAVLLRFAESGELERHLGKSRVANAQRLAAALTACARHLPQASKFTRPQGGLNLWVELPAPLDARDLLMRVQEQGVNFLPGHYFSADRGPSSCLRLSFGGLSPRQIENGIRIIGITAAKHLAAVTQKEFEPAPALV